MVVHFIYSAPPAPTLIGKLRRRATHVAQRSGLGLSYIGTRTEINPAEWPIRAPYTITAKLFEALKEEYETRLYHLTEKISIKGGPREILLGHPDEDDSVWNRSFREGQFAARMAILPVHHGMPHYLFVAERYIDQIDSLLGITGPYWYETWSKSAYAHWLPKIVPIDMAISIGDYPRVKRRFNAPGQRKFLFIGNAEPYKGVHLLAILFGLAPQHECIWIGGKQGYGRLQVRPEAILNHNYVEKLADEVDFFITMGLSDANPTTILEAMAWGFPVLCTPQSGYAIPEIVSLSPTDMRANAALLDQLQYAPEDQLLRQADSARKLVESHYTWERFTSKVINEIKRIATLRNLT